MHDLIAARGKDLLQQAPGTGTNPAPANPECGSQGLDCCKNVRPTPNARKHTDRILG